MCVFTYTIINLIRLLPSQMQPVQRKVALNLETYIYIFTQHTCVCVYLHVQIYTYVNIGYLDVHIGIHVYIIYIQRLYVYIHIHMCVFKYAYIQLHKYTYIHVPYLDNHRQKQYPSTQRLYLQKTHAQSHQKSATYSLSVVNVIQKILVLCNDCTSKNKMHRYYL